MERRSRVSRTGTAPLRMDDGQPRGRTGTEARTARSPLRLRLGLAIFGFVPCAVVAVSWSTVSDPPGGTRAPGWLLAVPVLVALVDLVVVARRSRRRRRGR